MLLKYKNKMIFYIVLMFISSVSCYAITGEEVMQKFIDVTDIAFRGTADGITTDNNGKMINNFFAEQLRYKDENGIRKKIFMIQKPANKRGFRAMTIENKDRKDDMWIYSPELRQVRRIDKSEKDKGMLSTTDGVWTNEDIELQFATDYNIKLIKEEKIDNLDCYVLELVKKNQADTQYSKINFWVVKEKFIEKRREFYNKAGKMFKTQEFIGYMDIPGGSTHRIMKMTNLDTGYITSYRIQNAAYGDIAKVDPGIFTLNFLETGRVR